MPSRSHILSLLIASVLSTGCSQSPPQVDASSPEALEQSLEAIARHNERAPDPVLAAAVEAISTHYLAPNTASPEGLPPHEALDGYGPDDLVRFHRRWLLPDTEWPQASSELDAAMRARLVALYQMDADALAQRREAVAKDYRFAPHQLPILDFVLIPPREDQGIEGDRARFVVKFRNDGLFPLYAPTFRVRIVAAGRTVPAFDRSFAFKELSKPVAPSETRELSFACCGILSDPGSNAALKQLPEGAELEVAITSALSFKRDEMLDLSRYTLADARREAHLRRCIRVLAETPSNKQVSDEACLSPTPAATDPLALPEEERLAIRALTNRAKPVATGG